MPSKKTANPTVPKPVPTAIPAVPAAVIRVAPAVHNCFPALYCPRMTRSDHFRSLERIVIPGNAKSPESSSTLLENPRPRETGILLLFLQFPPGSKPVKFYRGYRGHFLYFSFIRFIKIYKKYSFKAINLEYNVLGF